MAKDKITTTSFRRLVWDFYKKNGRHDLPWRNLPAGRQGQRDVYKILVSEVMLQQTQVERVMPFYKNFLKKFPTAKRLAAAPLSEVLKSWQGLGYNRRAKMLWQAAEQLATAMFDLTSESARSNLADRLEELPGVGPYTARAVVAFASNQDVIVIETNIRTAVTHHFFANKKKVSDSEIEKILIKVFPKGRAREWYAALMDYGAHLKRRGVKLNAKQKGYAKQSKFAGSLREARGAILRASTQGITSRTKLLSLLGAERKSQMKKAFEALVAEGLISEYLS